MCCDMTTIQREKPEEHQEEQTAAFRIKKTALFRVFRGRQSMQLVYTWIPRKCMTRMKVRRENIQIEQGGEAV